MSNSPYNILPGASFGDAARVALETQVEHLFQNLDGTREGDIESLHDMRVASRRLRAALSVFGPAFPEREFRAIEREASRVTDALGAVRDADVQIEYLEQARDRLAPAEQVGLNALLDHMQKERDRERGLLLKELQRLEDSNFRRDFHRLVSTLDSPLAEDTDG